MECAFQISNINGKPIFDRLIKMLQGVIPKLV